MPEQRTVEELRALYPDSIQTAEREYPSDLEPPGDDAISDYHPGDLDPDGITHLRPLSERSADNVQRYLDQAIDDNDYGFSIENRTELFPYDFLVVGDAADLDEDELVQGGTAISLFYRPLHIVDDLLDDPAEYTRHFGGEMPDPVEAVHAYDTAFNSFLEEEIPDDDAERLYDAYLERLDATKEAFTSQETTPSSPGEVLEDEIYTITGAQYGFMADLLATFTGADRDDLHAATKHVGAFEQLTDDLRDVDEDLATGNPNYLLEQAATTDVPLEAWHDTFQDELDTAERLFSEAGLDVDREALRYQAHYPAMRDALLE